MMVLYKILRYFIKINFDIVWQVESLLFRLEEGGLMRQLTLFDLDFRHGFSGKKLW